MKLKFFAMAIATLMASVPVAVQAASKIVLSNDTSALGLKGQTFEVLKKELDAKLGADGDIQLHHSGALFDQKTQLQGLQMGLVSLVAPTSGIYAPNAKGVGAMTLPFLLTTPEQVAAAFEDETVRAAFFPDLTAKNIEPVALWMAGPRELSYRGKKAILTPDDMAGVKIRVQNVPSDIAAFKAVGANVISMSWGEVPAALQQGVIDAVEPTPSSLASAGMDEIIDQMTKIGYQYAFYIVGANKQWWDGLEGEEKAAVEAALDTATAWNWENAAAKNAAAYQAIVDSGKAVHELSPEQLAAWKEKMLPVWEEYGVKVVGPDVIARLREIGSAN